MLQPGGGYGAAIASPGCGDVRSGWCSSMRPGPCGGCTACCTSSQFVHIEPDETRTLSRIPAALLFPAPGLPRGHRLMGYDENGHCPMLVDATCSIYADRPRTCRTYDCRIFPAADIAVELDQRGIGLFQALELQAGRARKHDRDQGGDNPCDEEPGAPRIRPETLTTARRRLLLLDGLIVAPCPWYDPGRARERATQRAVLAVEIHHAFLQEDQVSGLASVVDRPDPEVVVAELTRVTQAHRDGAPGARVRRR